MNYIKISIFIALAILFSACSTSKYDYTLHKPVVRYAKPSKGALSVMLRESYGKRYRWAEEGPHSFDCSGLIYYTYGSMNVWLPRRAIEQSSYGRTVSMKHLRYGDLIFFDTKRHYRGKINHVGIYVGNNSFIHASSSKHRVVKTSLKKPYYRKRVVICKRVISSKQYKQCIAKQKKKVKKRKRYRYKNTYIKVKKLKETKSVKELFESIDIKETAKKIEKEQDELDSLISKPLSTDKSVDKGQNLL